MIVLKIQAKKEMAEIEIRLPKSAARTKGLWLLESSRLIWEIWPRLGWSTSTEKIITPNDWNKPFLGEEKDVIMSSIERLMKITELSFPEKGEDFEMTIESIVKIVDDIKEGDFELVTCLEVGEFRKLVIKMMIIGVLRGLNTKKADEMEHFSDPVNKKFVYDKTYVRPREDFVFYEARGSLVSTYNVETACTFPSHSLFLEDNEL